MLSRLLTTLSGWLDALGGGDFVIRIRPGHPVSVRGRVAKSKIAGIVGFFTHDLRETGTATVRGWWIRGAPRLKISGEMGRADQQRVRNFLVDHLR